MTQEQRPWLSVVAHHARIERAGRNGWIAEERVAVVAQNDQFRLFVNGQLTEVVSDSDLQAGIVALAALSESGTSKCTFSNGWLWLLD